MSDVRKDCRNMKGLGWRVVFSALSLLVWFTFVIAWLFFLADDYGILQNIGVLILSVIAIGVVNVPVWYSFARTLGDWTEVSHKSRRQNVVGGVSGLVWVMGVALWLFLYAGDYSLYQNLAVLLLSLVPLVAVNMLATR
jgi:hypothetical protein